MFVLRNTPFNWWVFTHLRYALWNTPNFRWSWNLEKDNDVIDANTFTAFRRAYPNLELFLDFKDWGN